METIAIRFSNLSNLDRNELFSTVPPEVISEQVQNVDQDTLYAPDAISIVVTVLPYILPALAIWLLRKHNYASFEEELETIGADGTFEKKKIRYKSGSSEPTAAQADVISALKQTLAIPHLPAKDS